MLAGIVATILKFMAMAGCGEEEMGLPPKGAGQHWLSDFEGTSGVVTRAFLQQGLWQE